MSLLLTLTSILLFSFFSQGALNTYLQDRVTLIAHQQSYPFKQTKNNEREFSQFIENKPISRTTTSSSLKVKNEKKSSTEKESSANTENKRCRIKNEINLYKLLEENTANQALEELFLSLFDNLYAHTHFYTDTLGKDLLRILRKRATVLKNDKDKKVRIKTAQELAGITLKDPILQEKLYKVLKGAKIQGEKGGYPSLCDYLIADNYPSKINLFGAKKELLITLFDLSTAEYILENKNLWKPKANEKMSLYDERIFELIKNKYGKDFSRYRDLITFRIRSK